LRIDQIRSFDIVSNATMVKYTNYEKTKYRYYKISTFNLFIAKKIKKSKYVIKTLKLNQS